MTRIGLDLDTTTAGLQSAYERGVRDGFDVQVWLLADPGQSYDAVEFHIDFDRSILRVADIVNRSGDDLPNQIIAPSFNNQAGQIDFAQGAFGALPSGDMLLATITFRIVGAGSADLTFADAFPRESVVTFGGLNIVDGFDGGTLTAVTGRPFIEGAAGNDVLFGDANDNTIHGRGGADRIEGRGGNDLMFGNAGADRLFGNMGGDEIYGGNGADLIRGGAGRDLLGGGQRNDRLSGGKGEDTLKGGTGADTLNGDGQNDLLQGGAGADRLAGNTGKDRLFGGNGTDEIIGGLGDDVLTGGAQADTFVFLGRFGFDRVTDFTIGVDVIDLDAALAFADLDIEQAGQHTRIDIGPNTILLRNIDATDLTEQSFDF